MNHELHTQLASILEELKKELGFQTPNSIREAIAVQIHTAREAHIRIEEEGSVVRDTKGSVIPHPAIKIEADAMRIYVPLIAKHKM